MKLPKLDLRYRKSEVFVILGSVHSVEKKNETLITTCNLQNLVPGRYN